MSINITIQDNANFAELQLVDPTGKALVKKVKLPELVEAFQSTISPQRDTGYIHKNLLRDCVKNTSCRAYYFKEVEVPVNFRLERDLRIKSNSHGIEIQRVRDYSYLHIPKFKFTNILGFISNSNTEAFNQSFYQIYSVIPNILGGVDDASRYARLFPNQFTERVCWPNGFDDTILRSRDYNRQSTFVTQYLSSRFNTDLWNNVFDRSVLERPEYKDDFHNFLREVVSLSPAELRENNPYSLFFLSYYFLVTMKGVEPANHCSTIGTVRDLFSNHN